MVDRNIAGRTLEQAGDFDAAARLYEANVTDRFDGSHPYERLMKLYLRASNVEDAARIRKAWLANKHSSTDARMDKVCERVAKATNALKEKSPR